MHAIWNHLLDEEFMEAYVHRMQVECTDRIIHHFFPWIFTYSTDYPEKYKSLLLYFHMPSEPMTGCFMHVSRTLEPCHAHNAL